MFLKGHSLHQHVTNISLHNPPKQVLRYFIYHQFISGPNILKLKWNSSVTKYSFFSYEGCFFLMWVCVDLVIFIIAIQGA
jgi:hypothetical protein